MKAGTQASPGGEGCWLSWYTGTLADRATWKAGTTDADRDGLGDACDPAFNFGFHGLLSPYAAPPKRFSGNRTIPLKWQYTGPYGSVVDSPDADPTVTIQGPAFCDTTGGELIEVSAAGESGYQARSSRFNWSEGAP